MSLGTPAKPPSSSGVSLPVLSKSAVLQSKLPTPASFLVWADRDTSSSSSSSSSSSPPVDLVREICVVASVKLKSHVWSDRMSELHRVKLVARRGGGQEVCRADKKVISHVRMLKKEFMPRVQALVKEVMADACYLESDLMSLGPGLSGIRKELRWRKYLLFPSAFPDGKAKFVLARLGTRPGGASVETVNIRFDPNEYSITARYRGVDYGSSLRRLLAVFTRDDATSVTGSDDAAAAAAAAAQAGETSPSQELGDLESPDAGASERAQVLASIEQLTGTDVSGQDEGEGSRDVALINAIGELHRAIRRASGTAPERALWVKNGAHVATVRALCLLGDDEMTAKIAVDVFKVLSESVPACVELCSALLAHLQQHEDCLPVVRLLSDALEQCHPQQFVKAARLRMTLSKLKPIYFKTMLAIFGSEALTALGPDTLLKRPGEEDISQQLQVAAAAMGAATSADAPQLEKYHPVPAKSLSHTMISAGAEEVKLMLQTESSCTSLSSLVPGTPDTLSVPDTANSDQQRMLTPPSGQQAVSQPTTPLTPVGSSPMQKVPMTPPVIPKLKLPMKHHDKAESTSRSARRAAAATASAVFSFADSRLVSAVNSGNSKSAIKEIGRLAMKLGHYATTVDLPSLLRYKQRVEKTTGIGSVGCGGAGGSFLGRLSEALNSPTVQDRSHSDSPPVSGGPHALDTDDLEGHARSRLVTAERLRCCLLKAIFILTSPAAAPGAQSLRDTVRLEFPSALLYCDALLSSRRKAFPGTSGDPLSSGPCSCSPSPSLSPSMKSTYRDPSCCGPSWDQYDKYLWNCFGNVASMVERIYRLEWESLASGLDDVQKLSLRQRLDPVMTFVSSRMRSLVLRHGDDVAREIAVQLRLLHSYLSRCKTRVTALQCSESCLESLLMVKSWTFQQYQQVHPGTQKQVLTELFHQLLMCLDQIALQSPHLPLSSLLLSAFLQRPETWKHTQAHLANLLSPNGPHGYSGVAAAPTSSNSSMRSPPTEGSSERPIHPVLLNKYRAGAVEHLCVCVDLINLQCREHRIPQSKYQENDCAVSEEDGNAEEKEGEDSDDEEDDGAFEDYDEWTGQTFPIGGHAQQKQLTEFSSQLSRTGPGGSAQLEKTLKELFKKLGFVLEPGRGCGYHFLHQDDASREVRKSLLRLVIKAMESPVSPFVRRKTYIDAYCSFAYISFMKLYQGRPRDKDTLELCDLYVRVLLSFAATYRPAVSEKLYQLRVMDFLVREIQLEYELKHEWTRFLDPSGDHKSFFLTRAPPQPEIAAQAPPASVECSPKKPALDFHPLAMSMPVSDNEGPPLSHLPKIRPMVPSLLLGSAAENSGGSPGVVAGSVPKLRLGSLMTPPDSPKKGPSCAPAATSSPRPERRGSSPMLIPKLRLLGTGAMSGGTPPQASTGALVPPAAASGAPASAVEGQKTGAKPVVPKLHITPELSLRRKEGEVNSSSSFNNKPNSARGNLSSRGIGPGCSGTGTGSVQGHMTQLEKQLGKHAKLQLQLDNKMPHRLGGPAAGAMSPLAKGIQPSEDDLATAHKIDHEYSELRKDRKLYADNGLHVSVLSLILCALLDHNGTLDPNLSDQFPLQNKKLNIPFILSLHLEHKANEGLVVALFNSVKRYGQGPVRLLKVLSSKFFNPQRFQNVVKIASGAYGTVSSCKISYRTPDGVGELQQDEQEVVVKHMKLPDTIHDRCVLHDSFTEIVAMEKFKRDRRVCHLYDYGVDNENIWLVMKAYHTSLKQWRRARPPDPFEHLALYLNVFSDVLKACRFLQDRRVNHYDIKCDNLLVHPLSPEQAAAASPSSPDFYVVLADFGEAKLYTTEEEGYTARNRGTEYIKSPEMLTIAYSSQKEREYFDRRKKVGANSASDVWSIGCLLYELLTGEFLFFEEDWVAFYMRVTHPSQELIGKEARRKLHDNESIVEFLESVLVRNPIHRPTLREVVIKFESLKATLLKDLTQPAVLPVQQPPRSSLGRSPLAYCARPLQADAPILLDQGVVNTPAAPVCNVVDEAEKPTEVLPGLYVAKCLPTTSDPDVQALEWEYRITHVIGASTGQPGYRGAACPFADRLPNLLLDTSSLRNSTLSGILTNAVEFVRSSLLHNGRVLVAFGNNSSEVVMCQCVVVTCVMSFRMLSFYEAFVFVRDRCLTLVPFINPEAAQVLQDFNHNRLCALGLSPTDPCAWITPRGLRYRCLCGNAVVALRGAIANSTKPPMSCHCTFLEQKDCPHTGCGCGNFLEDMHRRYGYKSPSGCVDWAYTTRDNLLPGTLDTATVAWTSAIKDVPMMWRSQLRQKQWVLHRCKICDFLTHAVSSQGDGAVAVVTNIDCSVHLAHVGVPRGK